jgi:hypothetical protein
MGLLRLVVDRRPGRGLKDRKSHRQHARVVVRIDQAEVPHARGQDDVARSFRQRFERSRRHGDKRYSRGADAVLSSLQATGPEIGR